MQEFTEYQPIENVTAPTVSTNAAAFYLNRKPQTLRDWACGNKGALTPVKINGRLAWPTSKIKALVGGI